MLRAAHGVYRSPTMLGASRRGFRRAGLRYGCCVRHCKTRCSGCSGLEPVLAKARAHDSLISASAAAYTPYIDDSPLLFLSPSPHRPSKLGFAPARPQPFGSRCSEVIGLLRASHGVYRSPAMLGASRLRFCRAGLRYGCCMRHCQTRCSGCSSLEPVLAKVRAHGSPISASAAAYTPYIDDSPLLSLPFPPALPSKLGFAPVRPQLRCSEMQ